MEKVITRKDYQLAEKIINKTLKSSAKAMDTVGESVFFFNVDRIKKALETYSNSNEGKHIPRANLLRKMSGKKVNAKMTNECLQQLISTDEIIITKLGIVQDNYSTAVGETYGLVGGA
jgi:N-acetylmuramoyl-L-alanine amidase CwlA